jgi:hypothetical protein
MIMHGLANLKLAVRYGPNESLSFAALRHEHPVFQILLQTNVRKLRVNFRETRDYEKNLKFAGD